MLLLLLFDTFLQEATQNVAVESQERPATADAA